MSQEIIVSDIAKYYAMGAMGMNVKWQRPPSPTASSSFSSPSSTAATSLPAKQENILEKYNIQNPLKLKPFPYHIE